MTTEEMVEQIIDQGMKAFKKIYRNCPEGIKLTRHEPVILDGLQFDCWREYTVYKMGQYIKEVSPATAVHVELDGNSSWIQIETTDQEQEKINRILYGFIKKIACY